MEKIILDHWTALGEFDVDHKVKLVVDEYGPWYSHGTEVSDVERLLAADYGAGRGGDGTDAGYI